MMKMLNQSFNNKLANILRHLTQTFMELTFPFVLLIGPFSSNY